MWKFKPFMPKEQAGLEGRTIDIGNVKVHVRNVIAEGGFSCVYHARDAIHGSKQYALKHIVCSDEESLELVLKEISVMKKLTGHPNVVSLHAHTILDMGRTKEALIVMEFCEKSLVNVLDERGSGYFEEKQILLIFRDVCNAVFAMHCLSPPIAHRDLKAENLLFGPDGMWKLCDFGSTSTNHKRFERPEEMGIEEDNIRKYTTPAYRAPEMWDLFRREIINEKVDIWALGCLLYRICYFKSAFDGESKLQILNGNYRIPELPKYSSSVTELIRDMLQSSPDARPDITQVWFRVNNQLPGDMQKSLPDTPAGVATADIPEGGIVNPARKSSPMPRRSPPPPPSSREPAGSVAQPLVTSKASGGGSSIGAFWSTQHANESRVPVEKDGPVYDEPSSQSLSKHDKLWSSENHPQIEKAPPQIVQKDRARPLKNSHGNKFDDGPSEDFELSFFHEDKNPGLDKTKISQSENTGVFQNEAFNSFVADFDTSKLDSLSRKSTKEQTLEAEVNKLKEQLRQTNLEKDEITSKYEKLSAICRIQRQEIQEMKQALARAPSPIKDVSKIENSSSSAQHREKIQGTVLELRQGMINNTSPGSDSKQWQAFPDESKSLSKSVRTTNGRQNKTSSSTSTAPDNWGFGADSFTAVPASSNIGRTPSQGNNSQHLSGSKTIDSKRASQPAGWAGF